MKTRHIDTELREFHKHFEIFSARQGYERAYSDFLTIALTQFSLPHCEISKQLHSEAVAPYSQKEKNAVNQMFMEMIKTYDRKITHDTAWYDFFGDYYMELASRSKSKAFGQFFTPEEMCELMVRFINNPDKPTTGQLINDPTCGSGRMLVAHHVANLGNSYVGEDIDLMCCKMTVLNFLMHGVVGDVVFHDSLLEPDTYRYKFVVNTMLNNGLPVPHVEIFKDGILPRPGLGRKEEEAAAPPFLPKSSKKSDPLQLSFFTLVT